MNILQHSKASGLDLHTIDRITGCKLGTSDVACPSCGPGRRRPTNQKRRVLRVWRPEPGFARYYCARCGLRGNARDDSARLDEAALRRARAEAAKRDRAEAAERLKMARWLWSMRRPIIGSIAETYLRDVRCIECALPATLGFLPARREYPPAMIAAFGISGEPEPGVLAISDDAVCGVHITRLAPDGPGNPDGLVREYLAIGGGRATADELHRVFEKTLRTRASRRRTQGRRLQERGGAP